VLMSMEESFQCKLIDFGKARLGKVGKSWVSPREAYKNTLQNEDFTYKLSYVGGSFARHYTPQELNDKPWSYKVSADIRH